MGLWLFYIYVLLYSADIDFWRQNPTSTDPLEVDGVILIRDPKENIIVEW